MLVSWCEETEKGAIPQNIFLLDLSNKNFWQHDLDLSANIVWKAPFLFCRFFSGQTENCFVRVGVRVQCLICLFEKVSLFTLEFFKTDFHQQLQFYVSGLVARLSFDKSMCRDQAKKKTSCLPVDFMSLQCTPFQT